jgi:hypothetical protein
VELGSAFPADGEALEQVEENEDLLDDVAELPRPLMFEAPLREMRQNPPLAQLTLVRAVVRFVRERAVGQCLFTGLRSYTR